MVTHAPDEEPEFVRNGRTGMVHIVASDPGMRERAWTRFLAPYGLKPPQPMMALMHGPVVSLCGWVGSTSPAFEDRYIDVFCDYEICVKCVRIMGEDAHLAFEHAQYEEKDRADYDAENA
jgi:hypothetical protein